MQEITYTPDKFVRNILNLQYLHGKKLSWCRLFFIVHMYNVSPKRRTHVHRIGQLEIMIIYYLNDFEYLVLVNLDHFKIYLCVYITFKWFLPF